MVLTNRGSPMLWVAVPKAPSAVASSYQMGYSPPGLQTQIMSPFPWGDTSLYSPGAMVAQKCHSWWCLLHPQGLELVGLYVLVQFEHITLGPKPSPPWWSSWESLHQHCTLLQCLLSLLKLLSSMSHLPPWRCWGPCFPWAVTAHLLMAAWISPHTLSNFNFRLIH